MATPRSTWKGYVRLGLVAVPIKCFAGHETTEEIHFNQLHGDCMHRVRYVKRCPIHGDVPNDAIVSGYEYAKDQYVVIDRESCAVLGDGTLAIERFAPLHAFDQAYLSGSLNYLLPDGPAGQRPYTLLVVAMQARAVCAIAKGMLSGREQMVILTVRDGVLAMLGCHYAANIRAASMFADGITHQAPTAEEAELMGRLVDSATPHTALDWPSYVDHHNERLRAAIDAKIAGGAIERPRDEQAPAVLSLMDALQASVEKAAKPAARRGRKGVA